jgi:AraC family transcriptional regulator
MDDIADSVVGIAESAVGRAIEAMRNNLAEPLTVNEMARIAMFSKFHFSRIFRRVTGISPGRFMTAMRLARAKQLLASTSMSVTEISHEVGYCSVGTFSTRFSSSVGVSPRAYRRLNGIPANPSAALCQPAPDQPSATVEGVVTDGCETGYVFVGIFPDPVPQGRPVSCAVRAGPGPYTLKNVRPGRWFVLAHHAPAHHGPVHHAPACHADGTPPRLGEEPAASVATHGPIVVRPDTVVRTDLRLRPMRAFDPPVLLALLNSQSLAKLAVG